MRLKTRLDRLTLSRSERCELHVYLFDYGGDRVTGPNGEELTRAEAERRHQDAALVIDLREQR